MNLHSRRHEIFTIFLLAFFIILMPPLARATDEEKKDTSEKYTKQNVGGLLFDVDEGVKIQKGPGGSVYVESNREFMQRKFKEMDAKFDTLEKRVAKLESVLLPKEKSSATPPEKSAETRVLSSN